LHEMPVQSGADEKRESDCGKKRGPQGKSLKKGSDLGARLLPKKKWRLGGREKKTLRAENTPRLGRKKKKGAPEQRGADIQRDKKKKEKKRERMRGDPRQIAERRRRIGSFTKGDRKRNTAVPEERAGATGVRKDQHRKKGTTSSLAHHRGEKKLTSTAQN